MSFHFRGPLRLKQFAVYIPDKSGNKRDLDIEVRSDALKKKYHHGHHRRHGKYNDIETSSSPDSALSGDITSCHDNSAERCPTADRVNANNITTGHHNAVTDAHALERDVGDVVTVTMNGQVVSWVNEWNGHTVSVLMSLLSLSFPYQKLRSNS